MPGGAKPGEHPTVLPKQNWIWALFALAVWAGIFFAFLLIAIARP